MTGSTRINSGPRYVGTSGADRVIDTGLENLYITVFQGGSRITVASGNNIIVAGDGVDSIIAGDGNNFIAVGDGGSYITTGAGFDSIIAEGGVDSVNAGNGDNFVSVGDGGSYVTTGSGADTIVASDGVDSIDAGDGNNFISVGDGGSYVTTGRGSDTVVAGDGVDAINVGDGDNSVSVGDGGSYITAGDGSDSISAGNGVDSISVGNGNNSISVGDGGSYITTGDGSDSIAAGSGVDSISVGNGDNSISVGDGGSYVTTGDGSDLIMAGEGVDSINAGNGNNSISVGDGGSHITTGDGADTVMAGDGVDSITVGNGDNYISAGDGGSYITTGDGSNKIMAGDGTDIIRAGNGKSLISVGEGEADILTGGDNDTVTAGDGTSRIINTGAGNDSITLTLGDAHDTARIDAGTGEDNVLLNVSAAQYNDAAFQAEFADFLLYFAGDGSAFTFDTLGIEVNGVESIAFLVDGGPPPNTAPIALAVTAFAIEDGPAIPITVPAVDLDPSDTLTFTMDANSTAGSVTNNGDGTFDYDPTGAFESLARGETATDSFLYTADDGNGVTATESVTVIINGRNDAPVLTSATTASVPENTTGPFYSVTATDVDSSTLTYSLGGSDAALFSIDQDTGEVAFLTAPIFQPAPVFQRRADAGGDNTYDITVAASDGFASTSQSVAVTVTFVVGDYFVDLGNFAAGTTEGFIIQGDATGDNAGYSVSSAGDVNGDGFDDLIVGALNGDDGGNDAGEAYVVYGGASGGFVDLSTLTAAQGFIIQGDDEYDRAGRSVSSAGDVNGDGFDDLIVGAPYGDDGGNDAGEAYVVYGGVGLNTIDLSTLTAGQGFIIQGDVERDNAGRSVSSAGDVNGDGFDDVIVGALNGDDGGDRAGEAYVVYGGVGLNTIDLSTLTPSQGFIIQGDASYDRAGISVSSAGDVNGDGFDDVIVGAALGDDGGSNAGEAYVVYGGASGDFVDLTSLTATQGFIIQGDAVGDYAGSSVSSAGDVNGDGFDDLIVGAPNGDDGGSYAGGAYVVYGGATGDLVDLSSLTAAQGFIIQGDVERDNAGTSVSSAGDVNGDGFDDVIVGAALGDDGGNNAGEAYVVYGGVNLNNIDLTFMTPSQGFVVQGGAEFDFAGRSVSSAGDVNGDGFDDLIVGASGGDDGGTSAGEAYVIYGGATSTEDTTPVAGIGTSAADNFTGNAGDDTFTLINAGDVVRGGAGNDRVGASSLDFADLDGGHGMDTLALEAENGVLSLQGNSDNSLDSFEFIDFTGNGRQTVLIDRIGVFSVSDATKNGVTTLTILGDAEDSFIFWDNFSFVGLRDVGSESFVVYRNDNAEVLIDTDMGFLSTS